MNRPRRGFVCIPVWGDPFLHLPLAVLRHLLSLLGHIKEGREPQRCDPLGEKCLQGNPVTSSQLQPAPGTTEPFCAQPQRCRGLCQTLIIRPGCTRGCLIPGLEGGAPFWESTSHHDSARPGNPTPVGTAPGPHGRGIFPARMLANASRFFL